MFAFMPNRSPSGIACAVLCTLESGVWGYTPDGQRTRCAVRPGVKLYSTADEAILAARYRWRCNGGLPRRPRPTPIAIVTEGK